MKILNVFLLTFYLVFSSGRQVKFGNDYMFRCDTLDVVYVWKCSSYYDDSNDHPEFTFKNIKKIVITR